VIEATDPRDCAFEAEPESRMRDASVLPQIEIPFERRSREVVLFQTPEEGVVVVLALASPMISP